MKPKPRIILSSDGRHYVCQSKESYIRSGIGDTPLEAYKNWHKEMLHMDKYRRLRDWQPRT